MNKFEKMLQTQNKLMNNYKNILPEITYLNSLSKEIKLINQPFRDFLSQFNTFNKIIPPPMISQINELANIIKNITPEYTNSFLLSSSMLGLYSNLTIQIPDYLNTFSDLSHSLITTSQLLSSEITKMSLSYSQSKINKNIIVDYLIVPKVSGAAHYQSLKYLKYIEKEIDSDSEQEYLDLVDNNCSKAEEKIISINNSWGILLKGAEESLISKNPDKVRHTITSLRELITQILHTCAPDDDIRKIYINQKYYHNNKPTRRTRIDYILQKKYQNSDLLEIIDKDIDAIIELFNLYQKGTHQILPTLKDEELIFILKRTKLLIEQLL